MLFQPTKIERQMGLSSNYGHVDIRLADTCPKSLCKPLSSTCTIKIKGDCRLLLLLLYFWCLKKGGCPMTCPTITIILHVYRFELCISKAKIQIVSRI